MKKNLERQKHLSDHHNEDPWIKKNYPGSADKCFKNYTKLLFTYEYNIFAKMKGYFCEKLKQNFRKKQKQNFL